MSSPCGSHNRWYCSLIYILQSLISTNRIPNCSLHGCTGKVKPDIVFFGEDLPKRFFYYLKDFPLCDLVIIMGTSLEVSRFWTDSRYISVHAPKDLFVQKISQSAQCCQKFWAPRRDKHHANPQKLLWRRTIFVSVKKRPKIKIWVLFGDFSMK